MPAIVTVPVGAGSEPQTTPALAGGAATGADVVDPAVPVAWARGGDVAGARSV